MAKTKALLVFPPGFSIFYPTFSLPVLKGFLKRRGITVEITDLNLDFFDHLFTEPFLKATYASLTAKFNALNDRASLSATERQAYLKYAHGIVQERAIGSIAAAKGIFRSADFYDGQKRGFAKHILGAGLNIVNACHDGLAIDLFNSGITFAGADNFYSDPVGTRRVVDDGSENIFIPFYDETIIARIIRERYDFIGISVINSSQLIPALTLAKRIRDRCPEVRHVTAGGHHISWICEEFRNVESLFDYFDSVILHEGEEPLASLLGRIAGGEGTGDIPNLCHRQDGRVVRNSVQPFPLDERMMPDFDGFPLDRYFFPELILPVSTSRGCYGNCAFCDIPQSTYGKHAGYRTLPAAAIHEMVKGLQVKYGTDYFFFLDEVFSQAAMLKFAAAVGEAGESIKWACETRLDRHFSREACQSLYRGGLRGVGCGIESYNQRILDLMNKRVQAREMEPTLIHFLEAGIACSLYIIVGFPGETREELANSLKFVDRILDLSKSRYALLSNADINLFFLAQGCEMYRNPEKYGIRLIAAGGNQGSGSSYESLTGMAAEEARSILLRHLGKTRPELSEHLPGTAAFYAADRDFYSEDEENFLLNSKGSQGEALLKTRARLENFALHRQARFNPAAAFFHFNHPVLDNGQDLLLYHCGAKLLYRLGNESIPLLKALSGGGVPLGGVMEALPPPVIEDLIHLGFIVVDGHEDSFVEADGIANRPLSFNRNVFPLPLADGGGYCLFNLQNGTSLAVNKAAFELLRSCNGRWTWNDLWGGCNAADPDRADRLISESLRRGILYLAEADGTAGSREAPPAFDAQAVDCFPSRELDRDRYRLLL